MVRGDFIVYLMLKSDKEVFHWSLNPLLTLLQLLDARGHVIMRWIVRLLRICNQDVHPSGFE